MKILRLFKAFYIIMFSLVVFPLTGCKKFLDIDAPLTTINGENIYANDKTAIQAVTNFYSTLSDQNANGVYLGSLGTVFFPTALFSDEVVLYNNGNQDYLRYYGNSLTSVTDGSIWSDIYSYMFKANAAIEGINKSTTLTPSIKKQLLGESKFFRAFCYFYLTNLFGDVPLAVGTDPDINRLLHKSSQKQVYAQIIADLQDAKSLLSDRFLDASLLNNTNERVRPTKWAAIALLARAYLYNNEFTNAEIEASQIINNNTLFSVTSVNEVFLKNSRETIWSLQPVQVNSSNTGANTGEGLVFNLPSSGPNTVNDGLPKAPVYLSTYLANAFDSGDLRKSNWINSVTVGKTTYPYANKYKADYSQTIVTEYSIILRLSEQYLIRAESRIRLGGAKIAEGIADLNYLRSYRRAVATVALPDPLPPLSTNLSQSDAYKSVEHERQVELFTEWGMRWFDLKRMPAFGNPSSTRADEVMPQVTQAKGGSWDPNWKLMPIPQSELMLNPNLKGAQNPGY